jgi:glycosyltransferase involved in cell wall biosynthesis
VASDKAAVAATAAQHLQQLATRARRHKHDMHVTVVIPVAALRALPAHPVLRRTLATLGDVRHGAAGAVVPVQIDVVLAVSSAAPKSAIDALELIVVEARAAHETTFDGAAGAMAVRITSCAAPTGSGRDLHYVDLAQCAAARAAEASTHLLFLADYVDISAAAVPPTGRPAQHFLLEMSTALLTYHGGTAAATQCTPLQRHGSDLTVVVDQGFSSDVGQWHGLSQPFMVRNLAGTQHRDARASEGRREVDAMSGLCVLVARSVFDAVDGFHGAAAVRHAAASRRRAATPTVGDAAVLLDSDGGDDSVVDALQAAASGMTRALRALVATKLAKASAPYKHMVSRGEQLAKEAAVVYSALSGDDADGMAGNNPDDRDAAAPTEAQLIVLLRALRQAVDVAVQRGAIAANADLSFIDLSLRLRSHGTELLACGAHALVDSATLEATATRLSGLPQFFAPSYPLTGDLAHWQPAARLLHRAFEDGKAPLRVLWDTDCCGCCGFSTEMMHYSFPLSKLRSISIMVDEQCFCAGYAASITDFMRRAWITTTQWADEHSRDEFIVWISHSAPWAYYNPVFDRATPDYLIGRSMYEFTKLPEWWVGQMKRMHEVWVPSQWMYDVFIAAGMKPGNLLVMPEAIDTWYFDPRAQRKAAMPIDFAKHPTWAHRCNRAAPAAGAGVYKFLTNFKWEPRKGWGTLFEAYGAAFRGRDDVTLTVLTAPYAGDFDLTSNASDIWPMLTAYLATRGIADVAALPHFCVVTGHLPELAMVELYNGMDCFVMPTRGEGWGLPIVQSMALGKPAIATSWGGQMAYMTKDNSFLLEIDGLEEVPRGSVYGWQAGKKWATPSLRHLTELLRYVAAHPEHAARVGARARRHIEQYFSEEAVAKKVSDRLAFIRDWMSK